MADPELLAAVLDAVVPDDDAPGAVRSGGLAFLAGLTGEVPDVEARIEAVLAVVESAAQDDHGRSFLDLAADERLQVLDRLVDNDGYRWFASLVQHGFYADPGNGGNDGAASWRMVGWSPAPPAGWPDLPPTATLPIIDPGQVADRYDAVVIGSGAGGGVAACALTEAGRRVLLVERGAYPDTDVLAIDHLRNARTDVGLDHRTLPRSPDNPRTLQVGEDTVTLPAHDPRWGSNAYTLGGGTRIYGAQAWRFVPTDFTMATTYGIPEGSALTDWPVSYAELEPYYTRAEWEVGVSGTADGDRHPPPRSRPYPMPPMPITAPARRLADGAARLGWHTTAVPLAISSEPYLGRPACVRCRQCVGFACPVDAKNGSQNTMITRAAATGLLSVVVDTRAERISTDARGRVDGVVLVGETDGNRWRRTVRAADVVVSAGATETPRLLLSSTNDAEPNGLGNAADQVGRHLQGHLYAGALGIFADPVNDLVGPGPSIATNDFRHGNPGIIGGGMLANEFVPTPVGTFDYLRGAGLLPLHGQAAKDGMRHLLPRMQRVVGPIQEVTSADCRVRLDPHVRDRLGLPVVQLSGRLHPEDHRAQAFLSDRAAEWLTASGATQVVSAGRRSGKVGPSSGQHQAGTARMGTDPAHSVTDPTGRVWGHDNLWVIDGSLNVTNGGVNPVLTIFANALRITDLWLG